MKLTLLTIYKRLYSQFGRQHWWPGETPFEVMLGAILTQNTNWQNVEKAIDNLKKQRLLSAAKMQRLSSWRLASLLRPTGYYNIKARRLKNFLNFFLQTYQGSVSKMAKASVSLLRQQLLSVNGIGPETADSILLYALDKPIFVVDAYTKRILSRHGFIGGHADYHQVQELFMRNLKKDLKLFNEYHALLVRLGKDYCLKNKPRCARCPLKREQSTEYREEGIR
jgi:endonuclease-3 related protein